MRIFPGCLQYMYMHWYCIPSSWTIKEKLLIFLYGILSLFCTGFLIKYCCSNSCILIHTFQPTFYICYICSFFIVLTDDEKCYRNYLCWRALQGGFWKWTKPNQYLGKKNKTITKSCGWEIVQLVFIVKEN